MSSSFVYLYYILSQLVQGCPNTCPGEDAFLDKSLYRPWQDPLPHASPQDKYPREPLRQTPQVGEGKRLWIHPSQAVPNAAAPYGVAGRREREAGQEL